MRQSGESQPLTVAKAMIACMIDDTCAGELIASAVFCARGLGVLDGRRTQLKASGSTEQQLVERAVLFLFSLEGGHSVEHGMPPVKSNRSTDPEDDC